MNYRKLGHKLSFFGWVILGALGKGKLIREKAGAISKGEDLSVAATSAKNSPPHRTDP